MVVPLTTKNKKIYMTLLTFIMAALGSIDIKNTFGFFLCFMDPGTAMIKVSSVKSIDLFWG